MLTDLASMYLNAILNTKKLVDFKIIILFNCKWLQCDLIAISHSFYWKKFIYLISTYFSVFEIAFKYILARSVSITFTTYVKIILSNSKDVYSSNITVQMINNTQICIIVLRMYRKPFKVTGTLQRGLYTFH